MAPPLSQDRLVRKEVALGVIREYQPPQDHIGLRLFAPMQDVQSDDVIFNYTRGIVAGMAPARAEDAESEMAGKDDSIGYGSASIIDWAQKDHYDPSDVTRYREGLILGGLAGASQLPLTTASMVDGFQTKIARDTMLRRKRLDNRLEWLIMTGLDTGKIAYNDGKIMFNVDFQRPAAQQDMTLPSGNLFGAANSKPIEDLLAIKESAAPAVNLNRALISRKALRALYKTTSFTDALTGSNPLYKVTGWGPKAAADFISSQVEIEFIVYDSVYRTRALGSNTIVNTRFTRENYMILLPSAEDVANIDDTVGFGATLTSPHPEGNWTPGYYEWERSTVDPWGHDMGTGIKAFPVMPHLDMTYVVQVI